MTTGHGPRSPHPSCDDMLTQHDKTSSVTAETDSDPNEEASEARAAAENPLDNANRMRKNRVCCYRGNVFFVKSDCELIGMLSKYVMIIRVLRLSYVSTVARLRLDCVSNASRLRLKCVSTAS